MSRPTRASFFRQHVDTLRTVYFLVPESFCAIRKIPHIYSSHPFGKLREAAFPFCQCHPLCRVSLPATTRWTGLPAILTPLRKILAPGRIAVAALPIIRPAELVGFSIAFERYGSPVAESLCFRVVAFFGFHFPAHPTLPVFHSSPNFFICLRVLVASREISAAISLSVMHCRVRGWIRRKSSSVDGL